MASKPKQSSITKPSKKKVQCFSEKFESEPDEQLITERSWKNEEDYYNNELLDIPEETRIESNRDEILKSIKKIKNDKNRYKKNKITPKMKPWV